MGVKKGYKFRKWTEAEDKLLIDNYSSKNYDFFKTELNRTKDSIKNRAKRLTDIGFISKEDRIKKSVDSRFRKGHVPENKGVKGEYSAGSEKGWFPKGHKPANTLYDGAVTIRHGHKKRGASPYLFIRISERKWELLHRYNWMKAYRKIPEGYIVSFKNGDTLNCNIENLELISRKQNVRRNHNPIKAGASNRKNRAEFKDLENKDYIVKLITRDKKLREEIKRYPEVIELKKIQLKINREIKNGLAKKVC